MVTSQHQVFPGDSLIFLNFFSFEVGSHVAQIGLELFCNGAWPWTGLYAIASHMLEL